MIYNERINPKWIDPANWLSKAKLGQVFFQWVFLEINSLFDHSTVLAITYTINFLFDQFIIRWIVRSTNSPLATKEKKTGARNSFVSNFFLLLPTCNEWLQSSKPLRLQNHLNVDETNFGLWNNCAKNVTIVSQWKMYPWLWKFSEIITSFRILKSNFKTAMSQEYCSHWCRLDKSRSRYTANKFECSFVNLISFITVVNQNSVWTQVCIHSMVLTTLIVTLNYLVRCLTDAERVTGLSRGTRVSKKRKNVEWCENLGKVYLVSLGSQQDLG